MSGDMPDSAADQLSLIFPEMKGLDLTDEEHDQLVRELRV